MPVQRIERGDLWKSRVKVLSLRLRDRFRVAVDRRRRHKQQMHFVGDGYFSSTVNRWLRRFQDFRRDSLPSSSAFYCKGVSKDLNAEEESTIVRMLRAVAVPVLGNVCHVFMKGLNRVEVYGLEKLYAALLHRPKEKPLVTVSNHVSSVDDPFVIAALLPPSILLDSHNLRWTLCASDRCFTNPVFSAFFRSVKVLPVARGDGIYQKGMDMAIAKLNRGGWVHIFPEGSRSRDGGKTMGSSKRGVGRLILDTDNIPMVVPFVHTGMQEIMPVGANIPRIGKTVTVLIGDPIHFDDLLDLEEAQHIPRGELYSAIASRIGHRLHELKIQVDGLALEQAMQSQYHPVRSTEEMVGILQQVDWESFGMDLLDTKDDSSLRQESEIIPRLGITCSREPTSSSIGQETHIQPRRSSIHRQEPGPTDWFVKEGIVSRVRGFRDPTDLMGFAARGLFMNLKSKGFSLSYHDVDVGPLKAWKQFSEANVFRQCSYC